MPNDRSSRTRPGPAGGQVGREGARDRVVVCPVIVHVPLHQQPGQLTVRAGRTDVVPVEHYQLAGTVDQHIVGVQVPVTGDHLDRGGGGHQPGQLAQQAGARGHAWSPPGTLRERRVRQLIPAGGAGSGLVPRIRLALRRRGMHVQPAEQPARPAGRIRLGQVDGHPVHPQVEPQPAAAEVGGQPDQELPAGGGQAGGQAGCPAAARCAVCAASCRTACSSAPQNSSLTA